MIVSLLVALRKDQASAFAEKGISAGYISDKESTDKKREGTFCMGSTSWFSSVLKHYSWPLNGEECCVKIAIKGILLALLQTRHTVSKNDQSTQVITSQIQYFYNNNYVYCAVVKALGMNFHGSVKYKVSSQNM